MTDEPERFDLPRFVGRIGVLRSRDWPPSTRVPGGSPGVLEPFAGILRPAVRTGDWPFLSLSYLAIGPLGLEVHAVAGGPQTRRRGTGSGGSETGSSDDGGRDTSAEGRSLLGGEAGSPRPEFDRPGREFESGAPATVRTLSRLATRSVVDGARWTGVADRSFAGRRSDALVGRDDALAGRDGSSGRSRGGRAPRWTVLERDRPVRRTGRLESDPGSSAANSNSESSVTNENRGRVRGRSRDEAAGAEQHALTRVLDPPLAFVDRSTPPSADHPDRSSAAPRDGRTDSRRGGDGDSRRLAVDDSRRGRTADDAPGRPDASASDSAADGARVRTDTDGSVTAGASALTEGLDPSRLTASRDLTSITVSAVRGAASGAEGTNAVRGSPRAVPTTVLRTTDLGDADSKAAGRRVGDGPGTIGPPDDRPVERSQDEGPAREARTGDGATDRAEIGGDARTGPENARGTESGDGTATDDSAGIGLGAAPTDGFPRLTVRSNEPSGGDPERTIAGPRRGIPGSRDLPPRSNDPRRTGGGSRGDTADADGRDGTATGDDAGRADGVERSASLADALSGPSGGEVERIVDRLYGELQRRMRIERERRGR